MTTELTAVTPSGRALVELVERLAPSIAAAAAAHDEDATFPFESLELLRENGFLAAPIPEGLGGLGVEAVYDLVVASNRLARADASLAIGTNMHFAYVVNLARVHRIALADGHERRADALAGSLAEIAASRIALAAAISEPAQDLTRPATTARRTDDGWLISGRKVFCTMSPAADFLYASVRIDGDDGNERYGYALVPREAPGVVVADDWDALGMRASGSHSVAFQDVRIGADAVTSGFRVGDHLAFVRRNLDAGLLHAAAALGIAESAHLAAAEAASRRSAPPDARSYVLAAENLLDLSASRGSIARAATALDDHFGGGRTSVGDDDELLALFADAQIAKAFVCEAAVRVANRALALSGGAGYLNGSPLARAYRDARAGAFMHPLGANRAYEFLGRLALGRDAGLH
jgi:alkylation response protein AidB-like acyl-CoA dehydrogenase